MSEQEQLPVQPLTGSEESDQQLMGALRRRAGEGKVQLTDEAILDERLGAIGESISESLPSKVKPKRRGNPISPHEIGTEQD